MLIDFHSHCFPDKVAVNAIPHLEEICKTKAITDGTYNDTCDVMKKDNVDRFLVLNIATSAKQQTNVNNFAISINNEFSCSLGSIHADSADIETEFFRLKEEGIKGLKIHPDYQNVEMDCDALKKIYNLIIENDMFCVFHAGFDPVSPDKTRVVPEKSLEIHREFPLLKMVLAHMGGYFMQKDVVKHLLDTDIYFDTSLSPYFLTKEEATEIIKRHGTDKILFGSDCPWGSPKETFDFINSLPITPEEKELIFYKNAKLLLKE